MSESGSSTSDTRATVQDRSVMTGEAEVAPSQQLELDNENLDPAFEALERWFIREAVRTHVRQSLKLESPHSSDSESDQHQDKNAHNLVHRAFDKLTDFPPFRGDNRMRESFDHLLALAPKLDAALKARGGSTSVERFFVSMIASPIVSSVRSARMSKTGLSANSDDNRDDANKDNVVGSERGTSFAIAAAQLMHEILETPQGVNILLEELKTVHDVSEMRPSLQLFFTSFCDIATTRFLHLVRRKFKETKAAFDRLPRHTILSALKFHAPSSATGAAVQVLFSRPFGLQSFWQRFLCEALSLNSVANEFANVESELSSKVKSALLKSETELIGAFVADGSMLNTDDPKIIRARRDMVTTFLADRFEINLATETEKWIALRYVELHHQKVGLEILVDIIGKDEFTKSLRTILSSSKSRLSDSLLAKNSGFIKFTEELFDCFGNGLKDAEEFPTNDAQLAARFKQRWQMVQFRAVVVLHNVLLNDSGLLIHETVQWLMEAYQSARKLKLPALPDLVREISPEEFNILQEEARLTLKRESANRQRAFGARKIPPLKLPLAGRLLIRYTDVLQSEIEAFLPKTCDATKLLYRVESKGRSPMVSDDPIVDMTISWDDSHHLDLKRRGFEPCGATSSGTVWFRRASRRSTSMQCDRRLIEAITIVPSLVTKDKSWIVVPRNLNKGAIGASSAYLAYKRGTSGKKVHGLRLVDSLEEFNKRLGAEGWTTCSIFSTSLLYESKLWALIGS